MIIEAQHTKDIEVEISDYTARQIAMDVISMVYRIPKKSSIVNGKLVKEYMVRGGHQNSYEQEIIRDASPDDIVGCAALAKLDKW